MPEFNDIAPKIYKMSEFYIILPEKILYTIFREQWRRQGVGVGGAKIGGLGDGSPPVGSRGEAPVGGLGDEVPQKLKRFVN